MQKKIRFYEYIQLGEKFFSETMLKVLFKIKCFSNKNFYVRIDKE